MRIYDPDYIIEVIWAHSEDSKLLTPALQTGVFEIQKLALAWRGDHQMRSIYITKSPDLQEF